MNAFAQMAATLTATYQPAGAPFAATSKVNILREHMRQHGPVTAAELGMQVDVSGTRASALLVNDIRAGRVEVDRRKWPHLYSLAADPPLPPSLSRAIDQLEERGYRVIAP